MADTELGAYRPGRPLQSIVARRSDVAWLVPTIIRHRQLFCPQNVSALYPLVEVTFQVRDGESQFHIPLLLSANGYTTYRGS